MEYLENAEFNKNFLENRVLELTKFIKEQISNNKVVLGVTYKNLELNKVLLQEIQRKE